MEKQILCFVVLTKEKKILLKMQKLIILLKKKTNKTKNQNNTQKKPNHQISSHSLKFILVFFIKSYNKKFVLMDTIITKLLSC